MIVNEHKFVRKYSLIYTSVISFILLAPLYLYVEYKINIQEVKKEIKLKNIQYKIISAMDTFGNHPNSVFKFPEFSSYESGIYLKNFKPVYTQIKETLPSYANGYHKDGRHRYLITNLPSKQYFLADYLVTKSTISFTIVYLETSLIAFGIISIILLLSFYFLKSFSIPFQRVNEKLDDFIKESMHEMNTPLSIINVNVDLFDSIHGKNKYLNRIKSATKSLATIYNDMDYLIKQNKVQYPSESILLYQFINERVLYFELICQLKNIELSFTYTNYDTIFFNPTKLQRILDNTLSNAIKFSHKNSNIEIILNQNDNSDIVLSVKDYGVGIKNPSQIQERYYRENLNANGFGIGMCIVKSIIDESDISLHISSEIDKGSTFTYIFDKSMIEIPSSSL